MNLALQLLGFSLIIWASYRLGYKRAITYAVDIAEKEYTKRFEDDKTRLVNLYDEQVKIIQQRYDAQNKVVIETAQTELAKIRESTMAEVEKLRQQVNQAPPP